MSVRLISLLLACALYVVAPERLGADDGDKPSSSWAALPVLYYTSETGLAGGAYGVIFYPVGDAKVLSNTDASLVYTQKNQMIVGSRTEIFRPDSRMGIGTYYEQFPDVFYGFGPDTPDAAEEDFTTRYVNVDAMWQRRFGGDLYFGPSVDVSWTELTDTEAGGLLDARNLPGTIEAYVLSAPGLLLTWDNRDNTSFPRGGAYHQAAWRLFSRHLGSDYAFRRYSVNLRHYLPVGRQSALAVQGFLDHVSGEAPVFSYPRLGADKLRGYVNRYVDRSLGLLRVGFRAPALVWRVGFAVYGGIATVADAPNRFRADRIKAGFGAGLRFRLDKNSGLNIRIDFGIGENGSSSLDFLPGEGF